jgi:hypothetical protein
VAGGVFHPKWPISSTRNWYCPPTETDVGGREGSVVGEADIVVLVLGCHDEKIEWWVEYFTPNGRYCPHAIGIACPLKLRSGDVKGVWLVR